MKSLRRKLSEAKKKDVGPSQGVMTAALKLTLEHVEQFLWAALERGSATDIYCGAMLTTLIATCARADSIRPVKFMDIHLTSAGSSVCCPLLLLPLKCSFFITLIHGVHADFLHLSVFCTPRAQ